MCVCYIGPSVSVKDYLCPKLEFVKLTLTYKEMYIFLYRVSLYSEK